MLFPVLSVNQLHSVDVAFSMVVVLVSPLNEILLDLFESHCPDSSGSFSSDIDIG